MNKGYPLSYANAHKWTVINPKKKLNHISQLGVRHGPYEHLDMFWPNRIVQPCP